MNYLKSSWIIYLVHLPHPVILNCHYHNTESNLSSMGAKYIERKTISKGLFFCCCWRKYFRALFPINPYSGSQHSRYLYFNRSPRIFSTILYSSMFCADKSIQYSPTLQSGKDARPRLPLTCGGTPSGLYQSCRFWACNTCHYPSPTLP